MDFQDNFVLRRKGQGENGQNVGPVMFLATVYDKTSEAWTGLSPSALVSCSPCLLIAISVLTLLFL